MYIHRKPVQLAQRIHGTKQNNYDATPFDGFDGPREKVGGQGFKILQHAHAVRLAQNLMRLAVVAPTNVGTRNEKVEGVVLVRIVQPALNLLLDLLHALLAMRGKPQLLLVAP